MRRLTAHARSVLGALVALGVIVGAAVGNLLSNAANFPSLAVLVGMFIAAVLTPAWVTAIISAFAVLVGSTLLSLNDDLHGAALFVRVAVLVVSAVVAVVLARLRADNESGAEEREALRSVQTLLGRSSERYRSLIDSTGAVVWTANPSGEFSEPQSAWASYTGQDWPDHAGLEWLRMVHVDERTEVELAWRAAVATGSMVGTAARVWHRASGDYRWCAIRAVPLKDNDGSVIEWVGTITDVHELTTLEARLRNERELRDSIVGGLQDGVYVIDVDTRIVEVNDSYCEMVGYSREEILSTSPPFPWWPDPERHPKAAAQIAKVAAESQLVEHGEWEFWLQHRDGSLIPVIGSASQLRDPETGELLGWIRSSKDITHRKGIEEQLRSERDRTSAILGALQDGLFVVDRQIVIRQVNDAWTAILGYSREESLGMAPVHPFIPTEEEDPEERARIVEVLMSVLSEPQPGEWRFVFRRKDRTPVTVLIAESPVRDPATGEVIEFVGTIKDVTELARAEERSTALAELSARLAAADSVDEVAATALSALAEDLEAPIGFLSLADEDDSASLRVLASRGIRNPGRWQRFSVEVDSPVADAVRTGELISMATPEQIDQRYPGLTGWRELGVSSMAHVPFVVRGKTCVLSLALLEPRDLSEDELGWLEEAVVVTASALERAQRFDFERSVANTLQHSLLTTAAHDPSTVQAVHYQPAIVELEVGGDWYDTIRLSDGRVAAATGDAVGRGIRAAAVMGQLQSALAAAAFRVDRPHEAVEILDEFSTTVPDAMSATVALAIVDAASQSIDLCRAGHLPPIVVGPDGSIELVEEGGGRPLSIGSPAPRRSVRRHFPPGSLLLLYTDGLVERRGEPIDVGLDRLIEAVSRSWSLPVETFIERILDDLMTGSARTDDVALVALRPVGAAPRLLVQQLAAAPAALAPARGELRHWLTEQHLSTDEVDMVLLAVGEACSNSIEHGYRGMARRPSDDSTVQVEISREDDHLLAAVSDRGSWRDPSSASDPNRGRGIALMRSIMDDVVIRTNPASTTVTMRFPLRSGVNDLVMPS